MVQVSRRSAKKAESAWLQAVMLLEGGQKESARSWFEEALRHDPMAADAWLGIHATGQREEEAVAAMSHASASFGALRARFSKRLRSRFHVGDHVTFRLESARDLWLASVSTMLEQGKLDEAWDRLSTAVLDCDETRFVCARYAVLKNDWPLVLTFARDIQEPFLRDESQLYVGIALIRQQVFREALNALEPLPRKLERQSRFEAEVAYFRGRAYEGLGQDDDALLHYQYAFRLSPDMLDVADRARARPKPVQATVSAAAEPPSETTTSATTSSQTSSAADSVSEQVPSAEQRGELLARALAELEAMTGLAPVKRQIRTLVAQLRMAALREAEGLTSTPGPRHFVFAGPPGTGKTTVARIIGEIFAGLGLLQGGHVVEAQRVDLVGQHLGETAIKTSALIDTAVDGVLFIDEAYALSNSGYSGGDAFGDEALQVLLKRAEDDRDRLVVILVGYQEEITRLLATNPGLASRFTTRVEFPSYSSGELLDIARSLLEGAGDVLSSEAETAMASCFALACDQGRIDELGNGRFARELCLKAAALRDLRLADAADETPPTREQLVTLLLDDVTTAYGELTSP